MGPIQLIPHQGSGWAPQKMCERQRATYNRKGGTRYLYGAYDDRLIGRLRPRKGQGEVIRFLQTIRMRYDPRRRIHLVMDNLSCHWTQREAAGPRSRTSSSSRPPPTRATSTASSATSGRSASSSSRTATTTAGTTSNSPWPATSATATAPPQPPPARSRTTKASRLNHHVSGATFPDDPLIWSKTSRGSVRLVGSPLGLEQRMALGSDGGSD